MDAAITLYLATLKTCVMHLKAMLKAKIAESSGKISCARKIIKKQNRKVKIHTIVQIRITVL